MANTLNVGRATGELTGMRFYRILAMLAVGAVTSTLVTGWMRSNVVDIGMQGGDAVYSLITAALLLSAPIGYRDGRMLAAGAGLGAVFTILQEFGFTQARVA
jgi:hypothetical protein